MAFWRQSAGQSIDLLVGLIFSIRNIKMTDWQLKKKELLDQGIRFPEPENMTYLEKVY